MDSLSKVLCFNSFGVAFEVLVEEPELADHIRLRLGEVFGHTIEFDTESAEPLRFVLENDDQDSISMLDVENGSVTQFEGKSFVESFESFIRIRVAEYAPRHVFVHAGVVAIDGKALLLPGKSRAGKSTLVSELVRAGALYYSDEYAVLDEAANVEPFPKPLSLRGGNDNAQVDVHPDTLGEVGTGTIPCGMVFLTEYVRGSEFAPSSLPAASGIMQILMHTVPVRKNPKFSLKVLNKLALHAIIQQSYRDEANRVAIDLIKHFNREVIKVPHNR